MDINEQAIDMLRSTLNKINPDSNDNYYRIGAQIRDTKDQVIAKYKPIFSTENLDDLSSENFKGFLLFKNNQHWDSLHRQGNIMTENMGKLRGAIKLLLDENIAIKTRLNKLRPSSSEPVVKGLGRAVLTAILQIMYPDKYGILNNTAETGMKKAELWPVFTRGASFGERYEEINKVLLEVAKRLGTDLWTLDMLWWGILRTHTPKGAGPSEPYNATDTEEDSVIETSTEESLPESIFGLEKYLHEFLADNWDATELSREWNLLEEDGEIVGSKYYTGEVGEIDLLAKHIKENKWLVIELKKNQTSDSTVGQILRYMSWVRRNLASDGSKVEGLVICHKIDKYLQYALDNQPDISCMTYQINFTLNPIPKL